MTKGLIHLAPTVAVSDEHAPRWRSCAIGAGALGAHMEPNVDDPALRTTKPVMLQGASKRKSQNAMAR